MNNEEKAMMEDKKVLENMDEFPKLTMVDKDGNMIGFTNKDEALIYASLLQEQNKDEIMYINILESFSIYGGIFYILQPIKYPDGKTHKDMKITEPSQVAMMGIVKELTRIREEEEKDKKDIITPK